jgi:hypothetical protein
MESLCPQSSSKLPAETKVKKVLLAEAAARATLSMQVEIARATEDGHRAGMVVDSWSNASKVHIKGVLLRLGSHSFMIPSVVADREHHGITVAQGRETSL